MIELDSSMDHGQPAAGRRGGETAVNRKSMLLAAATAALLLAAPLASALPMIAIAGDPVATSEGKVAGTRLPSGVKAYLGIPYAKPPTQDLRWKPPQPIHWNGVWNAEDRKSTRLNSSHMSISYAVFCLKPHAPPRALHSSLHDALPISALPMIAIAGDPVATSEGKVAGTRLPSGVKAYLGIPYAKPPTQDLRWKPPQPIHWNGVWNA